MKKENSASRLEVWAMGYINVPAVRNDKDQTAQIIQIEPGVGENFMVEVLDEDLAKTEQHPDDRKCWTCIYGHRQIGEGPCENCKMFNLWEPDPRTCAYCETCKYSENDRQKSPCAYCKYNHDSRWEPKEGEKK